MNSGERSGRVLLVTGIAALALLSGCTGDLAQDPSEQGFSDEIQQQYQSIQSYEATVVTQYDSPGRDQSVTKRVVAQPHHDRRRVEYVRPEAKRGITIILDGGRRYSHNPGVPGDRDPLPGPGLDELLDLHVEHYDASIEGTATIDGHETDLVHLTPADEKAIYHNVSLWVDQKRQVPLQTRVALNDSATVTRTYRNLSLNVDLAADPFQPDRGGPGEPPSVGPGEPPKADGGPRPGDDAEGPPHGPRPTADAPSGNHSESTPGEPPMEDAPGPKPGADAPGGPGPGQDSDAETDDFTPMKKVTYDSRRAAAANLSIALPDPAVPAGYSLVNVSTITGDDESEVLMQYTNGSARLQVMKVDVTAHIGSRRGNVIVAGTVGHFARSPEKGQLRWQCEEGTYALVGDLSKSQLVEIGDSMQCTPPHA
jgi:outer membrane lipoprotein-sorting protein